MKKIGLFLLAAGLCMQVFAQRHFIVDLWPEGAPGDNGFTEVESSPGVFEMVSKAELWVYLPDAALANGQAVVICPGGGYWGLAFDHEGVNPARWMNERGIAGIVLKYRMPNGNPAIPEADVQRAFEYVREKAAEWHIDSDCVGIMGSSAGGHLASTASTHFTSDRNRPDFSILIYPVISLKEGIGHRGSRDNLIGKEAGYDRVELYSNELHVTPQTPPAFIAFSDDDPLVDPRNGTCYYDALKVNGVAGELHIYPSGGHGWGWFDHFRYAGEYRTSLERWLGEQREK